ncbi:MAG: aspartate aminotransferase family protein [Thermodesulfobacteriota bacterium]
MNTKALIEISTRYLANTYSRFPVVITKGKGCSVWDIEGKEYLDFVSGLAVCNLGHSHPDIVKAIQEQAERLIHISNLYHIEPQARFAELLCKNSFADKVFFCNSGAEANEAAIKLARKYVSDRGLQDRFQIVTMEMSFHGRTLATLSATAQAKFHKGFEPLLEKFIYVPFDDIGAVEKALSPSVCAVMVEPVQGEGGVNLPDKNYLRELMELCKEREVLLIFDEVQAGMGRTGKLFAHEHYGVTPDIMTLAKGLAGGVAMGAMLATNKVAKSFTPGTHASTFGGNPIAASAGIAALTAILEKGVLDNCRRLGGYLVQKLQKLKFKYPFIKEIRGLGLMIGIDLSCPEIGKEIVTESLKRGLLVNCTADTVLRFLPPLIVTEKEVDKMMEILEVVLGGIRD